MSQWYDSYLQTTHWQKTRIRRLLQCELADYPQGIRCEHEECRMFVPLKVIQVHHLNYKCLGRETNEDLKSYCDACHGAIHGFKRPYWWTAAKSQGCKTVTAEHIKIYRRIKTIGEVMFQCLQFAGPDAMAILEELQAEKAAAAHRP